MRTILFTTRRGLHYFDRVIIHEILRLPDWVRPFMLFMTLLGQPPITVGLSAGMIGFGLARSNSWIIAAGCISIVTFGICSLLKIFLRRARPDNDYVRSMLIQTFSFPSGHAAGSLASFGIAAYAVIVYFPAIALVVTTATLAVCFFIGISRVYLGAHYPSDVIGGWIVGAVGIFALFVSGIHP
ncbi:phosphatase PAP2 family protein [Candidatus Saccharibacteria bacterium]|nr:phosphatase PAP2 family protein [Candidatus Saccharibacteria bacterium]